MAEIKGKIHVIADRDLNNKAIYKVLHPETESSQITDFANATDNRIDSKISEFYNNSIVGSFLPADGTATAASNLSVSRDITISDASKTNTGVATSFNGGSNINLKLPSTIKADLTGNATTATTLTNSRSINIQDNSETHTGTAINFDGSANGTITLPKTITAEIDGNASTATVLKNIRNFVINDNDSTNAGTASTFNGSADVTLKLPATIKADLTGNADSATKLANKKTIALSGAATGTATEFNGTLDITIPVTSLDATKLSGTASIDTTGNAATATTLKNSRTLKISDADATNIGAGTSFNGSQAVTIALPGTIKADLTGTADKAIKLTNKRSINISDADNTNAGTAIEFDGSTNGTIKLPSTIKANLTGNADTATNATNDSSGNQINTTYAPLASPELTGTPTAPTATLGTKTTQVATTAFVDNAIKNLIGAAPAELDTLKELADAINNDQDVYNTLNNAITTKQSAHAALTSISNLTTSANQMIYTTASNTYKTAPLTALARNLLDDATASDMRTTIDALGKSEKAASATTADTAAKCTGNAATATTLETGRNINISDSDGSHTGTAFNFNGSSAGTIKLPGTITATIEGNASTATKLANKRSINISDADGTNIGTEIKFDGSNTSTLYIKLPSTIKATLNGNASTATAATKATNDSDDKPINTTYVKKTEGIVDLTLSNQTLTFKRGDNTTGTLTTKDEKMQQSVSTTNSTYPLLASSVVNASTNATTTAIFSKDIKINPNNKSIIASKFVGDLEGTADAAIEDSAGHNIATTYETKANAITGLAISGQTITYTKGNGTTGTITTPDTNTFVTQSVSTTNSTYPILATSTPNATTDQGAKAAIFGKTIKINPSTGTLYATTFSGNLSGNATSATNATNDSGGHNIADTYVAKANAIVGLAISGKTITYTKGNNTTGTITTEDQNVTQTAISIVNSAYPVLFKNSTAVTDTTSGTYFNSAITINPSAGTITAKNFSGLATKATSDSVGNQINTTYAPLASPELTGTPTAPTAAIATNDTQIATTAFAKAAAAAANTDAKVAQNISTVNSTYPVLIAATANATSNISANAAQFGKDIKINPSTGELLATKVTATTFTGNLSGAATSATKDSKNQDIVDTYIKDLSVSGKTITYTKGDGDTGTITTQDTTYSAASGSNLGLVKIGSNITNSSGTISLTKDNVTTALGYTPPTTDTNTHYTTHLVAASANNGTANAVATNGNVHLNVIDDSTVRNAINIKGTGSTTVTASNGVITINSTGTEHEATTSIAGLMSAADKSKLDGITASADAVSFTQTKTSGTEVGKITINGTTTTLYGDTNTDTLMTQNVSTADATYPVLLVSTENASTNRGANTAIFGSGVKVNPATSTLSATNIQATNISGNITPSSINTTTESIAGNLDWITGNRVGAWASNKTFGISGATTIVEYSRDGGKTWIDYGLTDDQKKAIFMELRTTNMFLGKASVKADNSLNNQLRITIMPSGRYVSVNALYIWGSTNGNNWNVTLDWQKFADKDTDTWINLFTEKPLSGWSGNNIIYFNQVQGFNQSASQSGNMYALRMTFKQTTVNASYGSPSLNDIRFYGGNWWFSDHNIVSHNRFYTWDINNNVTFPAGVIAQSFTGSITGNATTATKLATARSINIQDSSGANTGTAISFDGSNTSVLNIRLPATIKASLDGNADTATKLAVAKSISIQDSTAANTGAVTSFDGSSNIILKLPATIKANLTGNADSATKATNDSDNKPINTTYAKLAGAAFTGTVTASTAPLGTKTTQVATTAFVDNAINNLIGAAPGTLDTLEEIANAINKDASVYTTLNNAITTKQSAHAALTSISGLATSANQMIYTTASNTYATTPLTAIARTLLDDADVAAMRTTLSVPSRTGGDASGTWGINISGTAATATNDSNGKKISEHTIEYIVGTQTAVTGAWTGVTKDAALYTGKMIIYKLPYSSSGNATLNLTLSGGSTTGAKAIYRYSTTRLTTQYSANYYVPLIYNGTYWFVLADYDANYYDRIRIANPVATADGAIAAARFVGTTDGIAYKELNAGDTFDIRHPVLFNGSTVADAAALSTSLYWISIGANMQTIVDNASRTFAEKKPVYLKGTLSGNTFTVHSDILTTTAPTSEDGYTYLYVGRSYSTYQMNINLLYNQYWQYVNGEFQPMGINALQALQDIKGQRIDTTYMTKYTYASAVTIAKTTTTSSTTAGAWYTTATTINNISYARRYQINVSNLTANDVVEVELASNTNIARAAGLADFTVSASGCFYLYAKETPSDTFTIRYRIYKA